MSNRPASVFISQLTVTAIVGIHRDERVAPQPLTLDLELLCDNARVYSSNDLADTVDYAEVAVRVTELITQGRYRLLETMAEDIADMLLASYRISQVQVRVEKPRAVGKARAAGVRIVRPA